MTTPPHRRRRVNEEEKPKKNTTTTTRMALIDHFRDDDGYERHSMKRRARSLFQTKLKRVGLMMISSVFGQKKTQESGSSSEGENGEVPCMESKQCTSGRESQQPRLTLKILPAKVQFSFKSLFNRTKKSASENGLGNGKAGVVTGRGEESLGKLQRVSSRIVIQTMKMGGSMRGKPSFKKMNVEEELCKKRILMGCRCRPLNNTGTLHYDADGYMLPDLHP